MKIKIIDKRSSILYYEGKYYDTNKEIEVSISEALRIARVIKVERSDLNNVPYNPQNFKEGKKYSFTSDVDSMSGWGNVSLNLIKNSRQLGYDISLVGKVYNVTQREVIEASRKDILMDNGMIWHEQPKNEWLQTPFDKNIAIVPFETTFIPPSWVDRINHFDALFVPCKQNIEAFKDSGVNVPIELIHWGVDSNKFYPLERNNPIFTFGTMGHLSTRKGTDILVKAFKLAFPSEQDVRMICKTSSNVYPFMAKDKRIKEDMTAVTHDELMTDFFQKVDCFVFPTRGEGFGLTPLEAMATGMPSIVTGWSGPVEYMNEDVGWMIDHKMVPAIDFTEKVYKEQCGEWAEPSLDHLVHLMRYAYEHRDEVKKKGNNAAQYVKDHWLWENKIKMYHDALSKHL